MSIFEQLRQLKMLIYDQSKHVFPEGPFFSVFTAQAGKREARGSFTAEFCAGVQLGSRLLKKCMNFYSTMLRWVLSVRHLAYGGCSFSQDAAVGGAGRCPISTASKVLEYITKQRFKASSIDLL